MLFLYKPAQCPPTYPAAEARVVEPLGRSPTTGLAFTFYLFVLKATVEVGCIMLEPNEAPNSFGLSSMY
jgi:hypothetical protein